MGIYTGHLDFNSQHIKLAKSINQSNDLIGFKSTPCTGKSFSGALILASVNPKYDKRLFIEFPEKYKFTTCCVQKCLFFLF